MSLYWGPANSEGVASLGSRYRRKRRHIADLGVLANKGSGRLAGEAGSEERWRIQVPVEGVLLGRVVDDL